VGVFSTEINAKNILFCAQKRPANLLSKTYRSLNSFSSYELSDYGL
jgi:hypothetical protein